jgi:alkylhydroperoxidase family enzyme
MARVPLIRRPEDFPADADESEREEALRFFARFGDYRSRYLDSVATDSDGVVEKDAATHADPGTPRANWAALINSPRLANKLLDSGEFMVNEIAWCHRRKLRELMYMALAHHLGYHSLYTFHYELCVEAGLSPEQIAHLPFAAVSDSFDEEERFVVAYTQAVLDNAVTDALFDQGRALFGDKEMVELTTVIGYSAFKVMTYRALQAFEWREAAT